jgi:nicotinate-nucleotide pyrophosphorylase
LGFRLPDDLSEQVSRALREDIGPGDVTARLIPADARARARVVFLQLPLALLPDLVA